MKKLLKKLFNLIKNIVAFVIWSLFFVFFFKTLTSVIWNFNILSPRSWETLFSFWNRGGVFKTAPDIVLLFLLLLLPFIYIFGYLKVRKINFLKIIFSTISSWFTKEIEDPERVVIKGMKTTKQMIDDVKSEIESLKPDKTTEAGSIRSNIIKKLNKEIKK